MKRLTKILLTGLMLAAIVTTATGQEMKKEFKETFSVDADALVVIDNKFGKVHVDTWDKNQVDISVVVSVDASSEKESARVLDNIDISISGNAKKVSAVTKISGKSNCKNCGMKIDYHVQMPAGNALEIANEFGNTYVAKLDGKAELRISYGKLKADALNARDNIISMKFGDIEAGSIKAATVSVEYGKFKLQQAGYMNLYSRFSELDFVEVSELLFDSQYDGLSITTAGSLDGKAGFTGIDIGMLTGDMNLVSSYSEIDVKKVGKGFSSIGIESEFGGVKLVFDAKAGYRLFASASFGNISFPKAGAKIISEKEKMFDREVEAVIGDDPDTAASVRVKTKNSDILIK
jgi:hypothetical protein